MVDTLKNVLLILVGFLFGSSASGAKKDDTINAIAMTPTPPPIVVPPVVPPTPDPTLAVPTEPAKE
jgi:hypothetical protein